MRQIVFFDGAAVLEKVFLSGTGVPSQGLFVVRVVAVRGEFEQPQYAFQNFQPIDALQRSVVRRCSRHSAFSSSLFLLHLAWYV